MADRRDFGTIRKLPSGRYQATFVGPDLARHKAPVTFEVKDAAVVWLRNEKRLIDDAAADEVDWVSPEERQEAQAQGAGAGPVRRLRRPVAHGAPQLEGRAAARADPQGLRAGAGHVPRAAVRQGADRSRSPGPTCAPGTPALRTHHRGRRTKAYGLLRAIMNSAVDEELIAASPVHIRGAGGATTKRKVEPATPAELQVIADHMPERLRAAVAIAAWCALRYGELAELRRKDIDVANRQIKLRRAVTFPPGGAVVGPPKSDAGVRDVAIPPHVWPVVEEHLAKHVRPGSNELLFPGEARGHMWHSVMNGYFAKARKAAGREDLRWHDLRHTGATLAAQVGATTAELQARLGHSTSVAAQLYQHAAKDRDRQIAERLSRLVDGT